MVVLVVFGCSRVCDLGDLGFLFLFGFGIWWLGIMI